MEKRLKNGEQSWEKREKAINGREEVIDGELGQIDDVIGHFGKYQFLIFMFKILIGATSAFNNLGVTFFAPSDFIGFWCTDITNITVQNFHSSYLVENPLTSLVNQPKAESHVYNHTVSSKLSNYNFQHIFREFVFSNERRDRHNLQLNYDTPKNLRKECKYLSEDGKNHTCSSYQYDTGIWLSTIIDEWDLVCNREWFISVTQSLYMSGFIVSFLVFGYISDRFGRWRSLMLGAVIEIMSGFGCALASSITWFMIFRFLLGLGNAGRSSSSYLIMIEWLGPKWRMHISTLGSLGWVIGYCVMPWLTLHFLHFRHMQLFVCFYEIIFVVWLLRLPESPRWLLTHRRFNEAYDVLLMAAKFNGLIKKDKSHSEFIAVSGNEKPLTNNGVTRDVESSLQHQVNDNQKQDETKKVLQPYTIEQYNVKFKRLVNSIYAKEFTQNENNLSIVDLFKWKNLRRYSLVLFLVWAANSFIYYGIALHVGDFGGTNLFIAFSIAGITELPSIAFTILCMKFLPRRTTNLFIFTTTGLICALQLPLKYYEYHWIQQSTMMLAKLFNSCSFTCILYQTMELFPTSIRQTAYSSCSLAGRIGSILAPFIKELSQLTNDSVAPVIYAILSFMAAILIKDLPETKGSDLPDTLIEAEKFKGTDKNSGLSTPQQVTQTMTVSPLTHSLNKRKSSTVVLPQT